MEIPATPLSYQTLAVWLGGVWLFSWLLCRSENGKAWMCFATQTLCVRVWLKVRQQCSCYVCHSSNRWPSILRVQRESSVRKWERAVSQFSLNNFFFWSTWFQAFWHIGPNTHGFCQTSAFSHPTKPLLLHIICAFFPSQGRKGCLFNRV